VGVHGRENVKMMFIRAPAIEMSVFEQNRVQQGRKVKNPATLSDNIGSKSRH